MSDSENSTNSQLYRGVCKWFNSNKGYGFITITSSDNKDKDVFVHQKNINPVKQIHL